MFSSDPPDHSSAAPYSNPGIPLVLAFVGGVGIAAALLWILRSLQPRPSSFPQASHPPIFESPTLPLPPPKALAAETIDEFIQWVAAVPSSDAQRIRDAVALAQGDDAVHSGLLSRLFTLPVADFGRHQLLLSILGELRRPDSAEHLIRFVNLQGDQVIPLPPRQQSGGLCTSYLDYCAGLKARAVEMLAYLHSTQALEAVLQFISAHPSRPVRLAAMDAYLFNHEDSPEATERIRSSARPDELKFVGLPRRTRDASDFEARVADFYERHPSEIPPQPHLACRTGKLPARDMPSPRRTSQPQGS